ncbi:AIPR family protein [uncultured Parasutterella sp.]|uniref:AIPR family protein n=1 Tax=uncultured Parasutterella sp. TaxID=1263098 RepID=UPI0025B42EBF|nr:AIPR family protein [uncultured Parasutterella sp.]
MVYTEEQYCQKIQRIIDSGMSTGELFTDLLKKYFQPVSIFSADKDKTFNSCPFDFEIIADGVQHIVKIDLSLNSENVTKEIIEDELEELFNYVDKISAFQSVFNSPHEHESIKTTAARTIWHVLRGEKDRAADELELNLFIAGNIPDELTDGFLKRLKDSQRIVRVKLLSTEELRISSIPLPSPISQPEPLTAAPQPSASSPEPTEVSPLNSKVSESLNAFKMEFLRLSQKEIFENCVQILKDSNFFDEDINYLHVGLERIHGRTISVNGYYIDEYNNSLTLFILDQNKIDSVMNKDDRDKLFNCLINFVDFCKNSKTYRDDEPLSEHWNLGTEHGSFAYQLEKKFKQNNEFEKIHFKVITLREERTKAPRPKCIVGKSEYDFEVFDIERLFTLSTTREKFVIDFTKHPTYTINGERKQAGPLRCLAAGVDPRNGYKAYVGVMKGDQLCSIYQDYGQRVLTANVRAFLKTQGKVNKGIQVTIKDEPFNFLAFNNGICLVADEIESELSGGVVLIKKAKNLQIVNGGQTTASLLHAHKNKISLKEILVPLKLTVVPESSSTALEKESIKRDLFIQSISRFSNSQNKITDTDLGTNTEFQIKFKEESIRDVNKFQLSDGRKYEWYYERARGSYGVEKNLNSKREKLSPAAIKFDKSDLAKWIVSWELEPFNASRGAQKCYLTFSGPVNKMKIVDPSYAFITSDFYKATVAKGIFFRHLDTLIANTSWYKSNRSYKINIIEYTFALIRYVINERFGNDYTLNFRKIWDNQEDWYNIEKSKSHKRVPVIDTLAERLALHVRTVFTSDRNREKDVGELVKKPETWDDVRRNIPDLSDLLEEFRTDFCCLKNPREDFPVPLFEALKLKDPSENEDVLEA